MNKHKLFKRFVLGSKLNYLPTQFVSYFSLQSLCERSRSFYIPSAVTYFSP